MLRAKIYKINQRTKFLDLAHSNIQCFKKVKNHNKLLFSDITNATGHDSGIFFQNCDKLILTCVLDSAYATGNS